MQYVILYAFGTHSVFADPPVIGAINLLFSFSYVYEEVAGSQMVGVHVIGEKRDSTSQTMISPVQLKPELKTKLVR